MGVFDGQLAYSCRGLCYEKLNVNYGGKMSKGVCRSIFFSVVNMRIFIA